MENPTSHGCLQDRNSLEIQNVTVVTKTKSEEKFQNFTVATKTQREEQSKIVQLSPRHKVSIGCPPHQSADSG